MVSRASVQRYRRRGPARPPSRTWRTVLRNRRPTIRAADLLTVRTLDVLVVVARARREPVHLNVTGSPTAAWIWRQLVRATPWGRPPRYVVRDRDAVYGRDVVPRARGLGIETVLTPVRAPRASAVAERLVGPLRRGCLDQLILLNEAHRRAILTECVQCDNQERPHRTLRLETPMPVVRLTAGAIRASPALGGLHHVDERAA